MNIKKWWIIGLVIFFTGCKKDDIAFTLKSVKLNEYRKTNLPDQKLYLKVCEEDTAVVLAQTEVYPSGLTLPATFAVRPAIPLNLYKRGYRFQLWGDISGYLAGCRVDMDEYKIIFPIDMEVRNDSLSISISGSWK